MNERKPTTPWVSVILILANLAMAFWAAFNPELTVHYGFRANEPTVAAAWVSMFLHVNLIHLLGNMVFLAAVGPAVEQYAGWWKTILVYLLGGMAGVTAHWVFYRGSGMVGPYMGASGSIAALIGYSAVRFWAVKVPLAPKWLVPAWTLAMFWLLLQISGMFIKIGDSQGGVAYAAHIGGLFAGLLLSLVLKAHADAAVDLDRRELRNSADLGPMASRAAAEQVLKRKPDDLNALVELAESYEETGETDQEEGIWLKVVALEESGDDIKGRGLKRLDKLGAFDRIPSHRRVRLAETVANPVAERLLKSVVYGDPSDPMRPSALLALASLQREGGWAQALVEEFPLDPATDLARGRGLL